VYVQVPGDVYAIRQLHTFSTTGYETSISIKELDRIITEHLLHWLSVSEQRGEDWPTIEESIEGNWLVSRPVKGKQSPHKAMDKVEQNTQAQPESTLQGDLKLTNQDIARIERRLRTSEDLMDDTELRETYEKKARCGIREATGRKRENSKTKGASTRRHRQRCY
jgi:hypothetical protein